MVHKVDLRKVYLVIFQLGCNVSCLHDLIVYILAFTVLYSSKLHYQSAQSITVNADILLLNSILVNPKAVDGTIRAEKKEKMRLMRSNDVELLVSMVVILLLLLLCCVGLCRT
ncbi:hypothetical protein NE237_024313 [Protea cynaroides]|uniref:Uncharacterized protein n=1 Tax=Protea cynaroides TaxID=273540 RepID=A0A9Q0HID4_9MAGN|nr:hypothetical protein NE237_024313 [Protea cynaroides]